MKDPNAPKHLRNDILKIPPKKFDEGFRLMLDQTFLVVGIRYQELTQMPYLAYGETEKTFIYKSLILTPLRSTSDGVPIPSSAHSAIFSMN